MEWKIIDAKGNVLHEANCQYDAIDLAVMLFNAKIVTVNYIRKEAMIIN